MNLPFDDENDEPLPVDDGSHQVDRTEQGVEHVLNTWFGLPHKDERDDETVVEELGPYYEPARRGKLDDWTEDPRGRLALIILLDQVPRHVFRDRPTQHHTDPLAQRLAEPFVEEGFPDNFSPEEKFYGALPYLHAEDLEKQNQVNPIIKNCAEEIEDLDFMADVADRYRETIKRFGRFPHRNELLGRPSSDEEKEFLENEW